MFKSELVLEVYEGHPDLWVFAEALVWSGGGFPDFTAPPGFITDLASIPRILRGLPAFDPAGLSRRAAAMHDWLYAWRGVDKPTADAFLRAAMIAEGCSCEDADAFFEAVHLFGDSAWASDGTKGLEAAFLTQSQYQTWLVGAGHPTA
jgi:hypothetical protein